MSQIAERVGRVLPLMPGAAVDRTLAQLFGSTEQPRAASGGAVVESRAAAVMTAYLSDPLEADMKATFPAFVDTGDNDAILLGMVEEMLYLVETLVGSGGGGRGLLPLPGLRTWMPLRR